VFIVDEGNNEGVCNDMLDMEKIITVGFKNYLGTFNWLKWQAPSGITFGL
jgi:hypothetical protein